MKSRKTTAVNRFLMAMFLSVIGVFAVCNAGGLAELLQSADKTLDAWQESAADIESSFKESIKWRDELIDLYGLSLRALDRDMVGNFEHVKGKDGLIQYLDPKQAKDSQEYIDSVTELDEYANLIGIPFVYITQPDRTRELPSAAPETWSAYGQRSKRVGTLLQKRGVDCLDMEALMASGGDAPSLEEFYLKTDGHGTTYGEFWMAKEAARHLNEAYGISFPAFETVFDLENYDVKSYAFLGNQARSAGRYFVGMDQFEIYHPKFETEMTCYSPLKSETKTGSFDDVMLHGYERGNYTDHTYWITNFGRYPLPYYEFVNDLMPDDAPRLLVVCDSTFMSGFSYLALTCKNLTVVDPRYFKGTEYLANELALGQYDAVLMTGQSDVVFASQISLPQLPEKKLITGDEFGKWIGNGGFCFSVKSNGAEYGWGKWQEKWGGIPVSDDDYMIQFTGWAADFAAAEPFQEVYLQVGDVIIPCEYGGETKGVASLYGVDSLGNTGLDISFPAKYLKNGEITEVSFIAVSADGQYLYEPLTYPVIYVD